MCGLFGFFDKEKSLTPDTANELAQGMAISAMDRGEDATGYAILVGPHLRVNKMAAPATHFQIDTEKSQIFIGHTRFATMGDPESDAQAHPFLASSGQFALAHNGQGASDYYRLLQTNPDIEAEIDSEGMTRYLEVNGYRAEDLPKFYRDWSNSSYAISILDADVRSLILFRNNGSPLVVGQTRCGVIVYASTVEILEMGCLSASLDLGKVATLKAFQRYELSLGDGLKEVRARLVK